VLGLAVHAGDAGIGRLDDAPFGAAGDRVGIELAQVAHGAGLARILQQVFQGARVLVLAGEIVAGDRLAVLIADEEELRFLLALRRRLPHLAHQREARGDDGDDEQHGHVREAPAAHRRPAHGCYGTSAKERSAEPVPPRILSGGTTSANSCSPAAAISSRLKFSMMLMPLSAITSMCTGKTSKAGVPGLTIGGRNSKVSVSLPTTRAPLLIRKFAPSTPTPAELAPA